MMKFGENNIFVRLAVMQMRFHMNDRSVGYIALTKLYPLQRWIFLNTYVMGLRPF